MAEIKNVLVPDIGDYKGVAIIEVAVKAGDSVKADQALITLETDKAAMEVPAPFDGVVKEVKVKVGDKVSEGDLIVLMETSGGTATAAPVAAPAPVQATPVPTPAPKAAPVAAPAAVTTASAPAAGGSAHASPAIRRFARELGVDLAQVKGGGEKGRVTKDDVQNFVKQSLAQPRGAAGGT